MTTSLKNVGLSEPERSVAEDASANSVLLSPLCYSSSTRLTAPCINNMLCGGRCSYAAEVSEPRSSVSPSALAVRMEVTVSALKAVDKLIELRESQPIVLIPKTMKRLVKTVFSVLLCPPEPSNPAYDDVPPTKSCQAKTIKSRQKVLL